MVDYDWSSPKNTSVHIHSEFSFSIFEKNWTMFNLFFHEVIFSIVLCWYLKTLMTFYSLGKAYVSKMRPFLYEFANVMLSSVYSQQMRLMSCVLDPSFARM